jgi:hypothetical protein
VVFHIERFADQAWLGYRKSIEEKQKLLEELEKYAIRDHRDACVEIAEMINGLDRHVIRPYELQERRRRIKPGLTKEPWWYIFSHFQGNNRSNFGGWDL